jgi:hypothetical protein
MKDLLALREILNFLPFSNTYDYRDAYDCENEVHIDMSSEQSDLVKDVIQEYLDSHDLYWVHDGENKQTLENCYNGFGHEFGEVRKLTIRFAQATNIDKQYYAWRLKLRNCVPSNGDSNTESNYFETKKQAIDWVLEPYKTYGYYICKEEHEEEAPE